MTGLDHSRGRRHRSHTDPAERSHIVKPKDRTSLRVAWTLALECIWLTPLVLSGTRPAVLVISAIAAFITANLVWGLLVRGHLRH